MAENPQVGKRKGRGPGKGVKPGHNTHLEVHDNRIITAKATHEIYAIFKRSINGPWVQFSQYPDSELQSLIARFKDVGFTYSVLEEHLNNIIKDHVKRLFPSWMYEIRDPIFKKYASINDRVSHPPPEGPPTI
ncbi:unnamed protein product [Linum trigynum]|uniref:Transposase n=1 Tax=Linum trigynum TaxID=586398 RepID=A0AAV2ERG3_9ROSI